MVSEKNETSGRVLRSLVSTCLKCLHGLFLSRLGQLNRTREFLRGRWVRWLVRSANTACSWAFQHLKGENKQLRAKDRTSLLCAWGVQQCARRCGDWFTGMREKVKCGSLGWAAGGSKFIQICMNPSDWLEIHLRPQRIGSERKRTARRKIGYIVLLLKRWLKKAARTGILDKLWRTRIDPLLQKFLLRLHSPIGLSDSCRNPVSLRTGIWCAGWQPERIVSTGSCRMEIVSFDIKRKSRNRTWSQNTV